MPAACVRDACRRVAWVSCAGDEGSCGVVACVVGAGVESACVDVVGVDDACVHGGGVDEACGVLAWTAPALSEQLWIYLFDLDLFCEGSSCDLGDAIATKGYGS